MAVSVATALLLAALFAGDSVWTAIAVLLVAGGWSALALAGRAPLPGGGYAAARPPARDRRLERRSRSPGRSRPTAAGPSSTARSSSPRFSPSGSCSARRARRLPTRGGRARRRARRGGRLGAGREGDSGALPGRRPRREAARPDRLLERARARRRHAARACARARRRRGRSPCAPGCVVLGYAAVVAILLAASRAGVAAAVLGLALWLWLAPRPRRGGAARPRGGRPRRSSSPPGPSPGRRSSTTAPRAPTGSPTAPGSACSLLAGARARRARRARARAAAAGAGAPAHARPARSAGRRDRGGRRGLVGLTLGAGRIADEFRGEEVRNDPSRFASLSSNNRSAWWRRGAGDLRAEADRGRGREHVRGRAEALPRDGVGGHAAAQRAAAVPRRDGARRARALRWRSSPPARRAAVGAVRRLRGRRAQTPPQRCRSPWPSGSATRSSTTTGTSSPSPGRRSSRLGVLAAAGRPARRGRFPLAAAGVAAFALAAAASVATPWLAERERARASAPRSTAATSTAAERAADRARSLDPLSLAAALRAGPRRRGTRDGPGGARGLRGGDAAAAGEPRGLARAGSLRVRPRRPLLRVRAPERGVHARPGRQAVGRPAARSTRRSPGSIRRELLAADDERDVRAEHVLLAQAVERADDLQIRGPSPAVAPRGGSPSGT